MAKNKKKNRNNPKPNPAKSESKKEMSTAAKANKKVADLPKANAKSKAKAPKTKVSYHDILDKENLKWIGIGTGILVLGYLLMIGGKSPDPNVYDEKALFSFVRISLAPILICLGFGVQMYGIMKRAPKSTPTDVIEEKIVESQA